MIAEGLVSSLDRNGTLNVAPMGPLVEGDFESLILRPFQTSATFRNLTATRCGVFHVVDRVDVIARAAIGRLESNPPVEPAVKVSGFVLLDCCRWFEFVVDKIDDSQPRTQMQARVVHRGEKRPFWGFNRARHAVLETAILATRVHLLPPAEIRSALPALKAACEKTGGLPELEAFQLLCDFISDRLPVSPEAIS